MNSPVGEGVQHEATKALEALVNASGGDGNVVRLSLGSSEVVLPDPVVGLLETILGHLGQGTSVVVLPLHTELTTQQAADLLHVSRPYLVSLLEAGTIPHRKVRTHRRVRLEDLLAYKEQRDGEAEEVLDELTREAQELGLGY